MRLEIASANSNHLRDDTKRECSKLKQMLHQAKDDDVGSYLLGTAGLATGDYDQAIADLDCPSSEHLAQTAAWISRVSASSEG